MDLKEDAGIFGEILAIGQGGKRGSYRASEGVCPRAAHKK
jgi:hypothetical protein